MFDIVMWSKHGPCEEVLKQVSQVIPNSQIRRKFIIVDNLSDLRFNFKTSDWTILLNEGKGIAGAANTGLRYVQTPYFVTLEDDVILASDWLLRMYRLLEKEKAVAISGVRLPNKPRSVRLLQEYITERYRQQHSHKTSFLYGKTLDNTVFDTAFLRSIGGFPDLQIFAGIDTVLANKISDSGHLWLVDFDCVSTHLRKSVWHEATQYYRYGTCQKGLRRAIGDRVDGFGSILLRTLFSPVRGAIVAYKKRCWKIFFVYPFIRLAAFAGMIRGYLKC